MSSAGQKILFASLEKFYKGLSAEEKAYFDDGIDAPCPLRADIIKTKRIYFYKFLDQYLCYRSGPRSVSLKAGKSINILGGASLAGSLARAHAGGEGAFPGEELPKVLKHLGLTDYLIANEYGHLPIADAKKRPHFVVVKPGGRYAMYDFTPFRPMTYSRMCCSIIIGNTKAPNSTQHKFHAITGFMCDGKGYLFDSNQRKTFPCKWWLQADLKEVVDREVAKHYNFFAGGQIDYLRYNYVIFSKNSYVDSINPVCRLRYKATKTPPNYLPNVILNPAQLVARRRARARDAPILGKAFFNALSNKNMARKQIKNMENAGYKINKNAMNAFFKKPVSSFENVKREMASKKLKYERQAIYSRVYKNFHPNQRKILAHYRDTGTWTNSVLKKKSAPVVANSPRTARRKNIESKFKNWWNKLNSNNHKIIKNYIARSQSPKVPTNLNKLTTAKARAEWLKAKKTNLSAEEFAKAKNYVRTKNTAARAARKAVKK